MGGRSHNPDGGLELCNELLHWEPRSPTCIFPTARADNWKQKLMTLQYAQPIYLLVFYLPDKMLGCSCMLYLLLSAALRRSCFLYSNHRAKKWAVIGAHGFSRFLLKIRPSNLSLAVFFFYTPHFALYNFNSLVQF